MSRRLRRLCTVAVTASYFANKFTRILRTAATQTPTLLPPPAARCCSPSLAGKPALKFKSLI
ncbi:MAG: hypothetical protein E7593_05710 [Ruminococcaceae bacterium]|nr:hypothetical protein [Oscillospiraceae bacterium]